MVYVFGIAGLQLALCRAGRVVDSEARVWWAVVTLDRRKSALGPPGQEAQVWEDGRWSPAQTAHRWEGAVQMRAGCPKAWHLVHCMRVGISGGMVPDGREC